MKDYLIKTFLDYFNNYLSISKFAEHNEINEETAKLIIEAGRIEHERNVKFLKAMKK